MLPTEAAMGQWGSPVHGGGKMGHRSLCSAIGGGAWGNDGAPVVVEDDDDDDNNNDDFSDILLFKSHPDISFLETV